MLASVAVLNALAVRRQGLKGPIAGCVTTSSSDAPYQRDERRARRRNDGFMLFASRVPAARRPGKFLCVQ
jgi:hypothetical protein